MPLCYKIDIISELKQYGYNTNKIRQEKLLSESALQSMRKNKPISWTSIENICKMLNCQPGDILQFAPDNND